MTCRILVYSTQTPDTVKDLERKTVMILFYAVNGNCAYGVA
jgi:hypothetical protein